MKTRIPYIFLLLIGFIITLSIVYYTSLSLPLQLSSFDYALIIAWVAIGILAIIVGTFIMGSHSSM